MMRSLGVLAAVVLSGCGGNEELAPVLPCAPHLPSAHWPADPGVLSLPTTPPPLPFTPAPHRVPPPIVAAHAKVTVHPRVVTVIAEDDPLADTIEAFVDAVPSSEWWSTATAEYGVSTMRPSLHVRAPSMPPEMSGDDVKAYVQAAIESYGSAAAPDGSTVFLAPLSPGTQVILTGNELNCGCAKLSGVHFAYDGDGDSLAMLQRCSTTDVELLTETAGHEILEAATDPTGTSWLEPRAMPVWNGTLWAGDELTDICGGTRIHLGSWEYERSFSNAAAEHGDDPCVPALTEPYYNVSAPQDWYPVPAGGTVTVDVTGWATAPRDDWFVYVSPTLETRFATSLVSDESAVADGVRFYGINNGKVAKLTVTAVSAPSGAFTTVRLISRPSSPGSDVLHVWPVGFYVP